MQEKQKPWYVYLLLCADGTLYCGISNNLERRLAQHNGELAGGAKYTKGRRPTLYACTHVCTSKSEALQLEHRIRKYKKPEDKLLYLRTLSDESNYP